MARNFYDLPPFAMLASFEASARHASFKKAASELNVTPGAISHQVKALEADLQCALFTRIHRGVQLTREGSLLYETLARDFEGISATVRLLRQHAGDDSVTIAVTTAVSSLWLTPRLAAFWRDHDTIPVNQHVADTPEISKSLVDLRISYGVKDEANTDQVPLFSDCLIPVCSANFAKANPADTLEDLARLPLIHQDETSNGWTTWRKWFDNQDFFGPISTGMRVNNYIIALQAARDDAGLMLGWSRLIKPLIDDGSLVALSPFKMVEASMFFVEIDSSKEMTENTKIVLDWLLATRD